MMKLILFFTFLLCSLHFVQSFKCSNDGDCSNNGYCAKIGRCTCYAGYFEEDCSRSLLDTNRSGVIAVQIAYAILFGSLTLLSCYALYRSVVTHYNIQPLATNIRGFVFAVYAVMLFTQFLYVAIDPLMVWKTMPYVVVNVLNTFNYPLGIIAFMGILFHWIDLINTSVETLKREEMMQKINKFYKGKDITLEDMVEKVQFLRKLRIPFIAVGVTVFVVMFTANIMQGLHYQPEITAEISGPLILICYTTLCFGFLFYGRKLSKLIPYQLTKKVQGLTRRLSLYCLSVIVIIAILIAVLRSIPVGKAPSYAFISFCVIEMCAASLCFGAIAIFFSWQRRFPFVTFSERATSSSGTTQATNAAEDESDFAVSVADA